MGSARATSPEIKSPNFVKDSATTLQKVPEGPQRSMAFLGLMADSVGGGMMGRTGKATITRDAEPRKDMEEENQVIKDKSADNFDMDNVRRRLLEKAKEERAKRSEQLAQEKQIYDQSLPESTKKMKKSPLQFMVRGG